MILLNLNLKEVLKIVRNKNIVEGLVEKTEEAAMTLEVVFNI